MKNRVIVFCALALVATLCLSSCKNSKSGQNQAPLVGRLVISEICQHLVVAIESGSFDPEKVTASYTDEKRGKTFKNVFTIENRCLFGESNIKEGDRFNFEWMPDNIKETCMNCMAFYPTPDTRASIKVIRKIEN